MPRPPAGITLSPLDALLLLMAGAWAAALRSTPEAAWSAPVVLGHFFLFCNVFRIHRNKELVWAGAFVVAMLGTRAATGNMNWPLGALLVSPLTVALIALEMRSPDYHGIGCRRINRAGIDAYLRRREEWLRARNERAKP